MKFMKSLTWILCAVAVAVALFVYLDVAGVELRDEFGQFVVDRLIALTLIAAVVERALEVLIEPWRGPKKAELEAENRGGELARYGNDTRLISMTVGTAFGLLIAAIGFRLIEPMAGGSDWTEAGTSLSVMRTVDVVLVALLIGGGSDGLHKLVSVVIDSLNATRAKIAAASPDG